MQTVKTKLGVAGVLIAIYSFFVPFPYYFSGYADLYEKYGRASAIPSSNGLGIHSIRILGDITYFGLVFGLDLIVFLVPAVLLLANCNTKDRFEIFVKNALLIVVLFYLFRRNLMGSSICAVLD
jgi:hypothetical protein